MNCSRTAMLMLIHVCEHMNKINQNKINGNSSGFHRTAFSSTVSRNYVVFLLREANQKTWRKTLRTGTRINNKLNTHKYMTSTPEINPDNIDGRHLSPVHHPCSTKKTENKATFNYKYGHKACHYRCIGTNRYVALHSYKVALQ